MDYFGLDDDDPPTFDRIYFPFNVDKKHWAGVCVCVGSSSIEIFDCITAKRTEKALKQDLTSLSQMLPYILNRPDDPSREEKSFTIVKAKGVPQNTNPNDSGITTVLLIQAHSIAGTDGCKCIIPDGIAEEAQKLAVLFFQAYGEAV